MAGEVARAYVSLIPSVRGFKERLRRQINKPVREEGGHEGRMFGQRFTRSMGSYFTTGFAQRLKRNFRPSLLGVAAGLGPLLVPALAGATAAAAGFGSALAAAGLGAGGFAAIAIPAFQKVQKVTEQVAAAQHAYNLAATDAARQSALRREQAALATLTSGERELAKVLGTVRNAWHDVQRQLEPAVVKALVPWVGALRDAFRFLAPVVRPAARAIGIIGSEMRLVFRDPAAMRFFRQIGQFGAKAIQSFGVSAINLGKGLGSLLLAFRPISALLLNALPNITAQFSNWAASLSGSKGFQSFIAYVTANGPRLLSILGSIVQIAGKLITGLAPLGAVLLGLLAPLGQFLAKLSPNQLMVIALGIAAAFAVATGGFTAIVTAVVLMAAIIVRNWSHIRAFILGVSRAILSWLRGYWKLLVSIISGPVGAVVVFVISHWNRIRAVTSAVWHAVVGLVRGAIHGVAAAVSWVGSLPGRFAAWFGRARSAAGSALGRLAGDVRSIPGRILSALGNLGSLLYQAGRNVIQGLINGIMSMFGSIGGAMGSIVGKLRGFLPFSPAKEGPLSGAGSPHLAGRKIARMVADGMSYGVPDVASAAARLAASAALVPGSAASVLSGAPGGAAGTYHLHFDGLTRGAIEQHVRAGLQAAAVAERRRLRPGRPA